MSVLIAIVIAAALASLLLLLLGRKSSSKGKKSSAGTSKHKNQILREASKVLAKDPHNPAGLIPMAEIYFQSQLWDKAFPIYDELAKLGVKPGASSTIDLYKVSLRAGICALKIDKIQEAVINLMGACKMSPTAFESNYYLGLALYKSQNYIQAAPLLKKAILAKPDSTGIYKTLSLSLYNAKKYRDSLPCFKKALEEEPGNKEMLYSMAFAMLQEGHGDNALKVFSHLRADPTYGADSCLQAGLFHAKTRRTDDAIQDFEIGLKHQKIPQETKIEIEYNLARCYFEKGMISKGLDVLKKLRAANPNYKDVNSLITRYQELSQNSNLQIYISSSSGEFVTLCRKFIAKKYKDSMVKVHNVESDALYTDILAEVYSSRWEDVALFRFFRTTGSTGEIYIRDFHSHMQDVKAARGFCISAGEFSAEAHKYIEGRPIDLIEKPELIKVLKHITM